ncbi:uncharacterized protein [Lolium perenne]|uniref:uncharacterized protein n=1 Tax=Lolium perenne TaxID=4522 RepID=UPI003A99926F
MKVLYTNAAASVEEWLTNLEASLDSYARKIVGLDVEYDKLGGTYFNPKKAAVIQLCVGTDVLVYHICHVDERSEKLYDFFYGYRYTFAGFCVAEDRTILSRSKYYVHNVKDIQAIWRDPDNRKRTQGLKDVAGAIIDPIYFEMKDGFGRASTGCGLIRRLYRLSIWNILHGMHMPRVIAVPQAAFLRKF